jgi:subtilisin family serine protease
MSDLDGQPGALNANGCGNSDDAPAGFSNFATLLSDQAHTLAAPGVCIFSTSINSGYRTGSGTSYSTPHAAGTAALCIATGNCTGPPRQVIQKLRSDATAYNTANPRYGFDGDPLRPITGKYYGYLIRAGRY